MSTVETIGAFDNLADVKFALLTTFRRNGAPVPTPICHSVAGGVVYLTTMDDTGKVKRIRNDPRILIGACDMKGNPTGPSYAASARILASNELQGTTVFKETRFIGTVFVSAAHAHWLVKPIQIYERLRFRRRFVGIAIEAAAIVDPPQRGMN